MTIGLVGVTLTLIFGILLGGLSGYLGGTVDLVIQRVIEFLRPKFRVILFVEHTRQFVEGILAQTDLRNEIENYQPWHMERLKAVPGLTGLWQVSGRSQIGFSEWMQLDLEYIDNWSLSLDLDILLKTLPAVLRGTGAS